MTLLPSYSPPPPVNRMCRTKASVSAAYAHRLPRSLIEQSQRRGLKKVTESTAGIIPGDRGMVEGSWFLPPRHNAQALRKAYLTSSSDRSRVRLSHTKHGVERRGAIRNRARAESGPRDVSTREPTQLPRGFWLLLRRPERSRVIRRAHPAKRPDPLADGARKEGTAAGSERTWQSS